MGFKEDIAKESWKVYRTGNNTIKMEIKGYGTGRGAVEAIDTFDQYAMEIEGPVRLIVDLHEFVGYEKEVREMWQHVVARHKEKGINIQARGVKSTMVRMAVRVLSMTTGVDIEITS